MRIQIEKIEFETGKKIEKVKRESSIRKLRDEIRKIESETRVMKVERESRAKK